MEPVLRIPDPNINVTPNNEPEENIVVAENPPQAPVAQELDDEFDTAEINSDHCKAEELVFINSLHAHRDLSKSFKDTLRTKKKKLLTFFLSKCDQYIKIPPVGEHEGTDID
jgi:hypothetical protein